MTDVDAAPPAAVASPRPPAPAAAATPESKQFPDLDSLLKLVPSIARQARSNKPPLYCCVDMMRWFLQGGSHAAPTVDARGAQRLLSGVADRVDWNEYMHKCSVRGLAGVGLASTVQCAPPQLLLCGAVMTMMAHRRPADAVRARGYDLAAHFWRLMQTAGWVEETVPVADSSSSSSSSSAAQAAATPAPPVWTFRLSLLTELDYVAVDLATRAVQLQQAKEGKMERRRVRQAKKAAKDALVEHFKTEEAQAEAASSQLDLAASGGAGSGGDEQGSSQDDEHTDTDDDQENQEESKNRDDDEEEEEHERESAAESGGGSSSSSSSAPMDVDEKQEPGDATRSEVIDSVSTVVEAASRAARAAQRVRDELVAMRQLLEEMQQVWQQRPLLRGILDDAARRVATRALESLKQVFAAALQPAAK